MSMLSELREGPDIVQRLLDNAGGQIDRVARAVRARNIELAVIAARGTSDHAAIYAQYILGARNGILVAPAAPSLTSLYGTTPCVDRALVLGISQSGRSPDVVSVLAESRRQGALTVAITNEPASELAQAAEYLVELEAGPEVAVAATKTYLAEIAVVAMLSAALSEDERSRAELAALPDALRLVLDREPMIAPLAQSWSRQSRCAVLARGFQYATAREWALKLKELAYVLADPYSAADFQHGPIALVGAGFPVLAVATSGPALEGMIELFERLRAGQAKLLVMSDDDRLRFFGDFISLPSVPEWLAPLVAILPAQLFAYHLARARGLDTENPRNITKVTLTK